jgi:hypothetical protein
MRKMPNSKISEVIEYIKALEDSEEKHQIIESLNAELAAIHHPEAPVANVRWIPITSVQANDYNPNSVPKNEMRLLYLSIKADGYTQPIVTIYDEEIQKYVIVDGFHRYTTMRVNPDLLEASRGYMPCVVIEKTINERMAATVRHNRARGKHSVQGMASMVFAMLENGKTDEEICQELGMEATELTRHKHISGFSKLFANVEYKKDWMIDKQIAQKKKWIHDNPQEVGYDPKNHVNQEK